MNKTSTGRDGLQALWLQEIAGVTFSLFRWVALLCCGNSKPIIYKNMSIKKPVNAYEQGTHGKN